MKFSQATVLSLIGFIIVVGATCLFKVNEGQHALVTRFGRIIERNNDDKNTFGPGLHYKLPMVEKVHKFDTRLQTFDEQSSRIMTSEKKDMIVDYYVKWRVANLADYYTNAGGSPIRVQKLVQQQIDDNLRSQFGRRTIREVISDDRTVIMRLLKESTAIDVEKLGVKIIDVRIKTIDLPKEVSQSVFDNMRAEREAVAKEHRAKGMARAEGIRAEADASATVIIATAKEKSDKIRAEGDATAAKIYSDAYTQEADFYSFYRSLQAYHKTFNKDSHNILVLSPDNQYFKYFNAMDNNKQSTVKRHANELG